MKRSVITKVWCIFRCLISEACLVGNSRCHYCVEKVNNRTCRIQGECKEMQFGKKEDVRGNSYDQGFSPRSQQSFRNVISAVLSPLVFASPKLTTKVFKEASFVPRSAMRYSLEKRSFYDALSCENTRRDFELSIKTLDIYIFVWVLRHRSALLGSLTFCFAEKKFTFISVLYMTERRFVFFPLFFSSLCTSERTSV